MADSYESARKNFLSSPIRVKFRRRAAEICDVPPETVALRARDAAEDARYEIRTFRRDAGPQGRFSEI